MATICARCGAKQGLLSNSEWDQASGGIVCSTCIQQEREQKAEIERQRVEKIRQASEKVVLTSTPGIDGYRVRKYLGIESVEFVIGTGAFSEVSTSIADFFGARSSAFERKLRAAKQHAMEALRYAAAERGANAVVAVDLDYTEFTVNRIALIVNGTCVAVERIDKPSRAGS